MMYFRLYKACMMNLRDNRDRDFYIFTKYDYTAFMCPTVSLNRNPITRIYDALVKALNTKNKLPRHLFILTDDKLNKKAENFAERSMKWLLNEIQRAILTWIEDVPQRYKPNYLTHITVVKPLPYPYWFPDYKQQAKLKRKIISAITAEIPNLKYFNLGLHPTRGQFPV